MKGIEAGCDDFLSKPVDKMELFARVRSLLQVKAYNDLMKDYQIELEAMVTSRTEELRYSLENLQQEITERKRVEEALRESEDRSGAAWSTPRMASTRPIWKVTSFTATSSAKRSSVTGVKS
ncbi:MAG: hypothetical protein U5R49_12535 [Deltaproteobacteria bacterium]|nr:hypothetical protein [Deltaproteobacteria bacterium]